MKRRVAESWATFERMVIPDVSDVQRSEMRRAYYAGSFALLEVIASALSEGDETTAADEQVMVDLEVERQQYMVDLLAGRA
jgi:hypothetical protein